MSNYIIVGSDYLDDILDRLKALDDKTEHIRMELEDLESAKYDIEKLLTRVIRNADRYDDD